MKIAVVDNEKLWRQNIDTFVRKWYEDKELSLDIFESGDEFLKMKTKYDIVVLDVEMPEKDGFETAQEYRKLFPEAIIILLTIHLEMSRKGYVVNAFRYVDKTNMQYELEEAFISAGKLLERNAVITLQVTNMGKIPIPLKDILYIETDLRKLLVHTKETVFICSDSIGNLEKQLPEDLFYRCHKSYIVNLDAIKKVDNAVAYLSDGSKLMVGIKKYPILKKKYMERKYQCINL